MPTKTPPNAPAVLYLMHVDWLWIKQRPHFIAENLAAGQRVIVLYRPHLKKPVFKLRGSLVLIPLLPIPRRAGRALERLDAWLNAAFVALLVRVLRVQVAYLTFPTLLRYLTLTRLPLIYDCMDDAAEFDFPLAEKQQILRLERQLVPQSRRVIFSTGTLRQAVAGRCVGFDLAHSAVIRNGAPPGLTVWDKATRPGARGLPFELVYFGAIAPWFDFQTVLRLLEHFPQVRLTLYGPATVEIPRHPRLIVGGTLKHAELLEVSRDADAFIMPFIVNDLIRSVDPVKMYEYIALSHRVLSVAYPEVEFFGEFVRLYRSPQEAITLLAELMEDHEPRLEQRQRFIQANSWRQRTAAVQEILDQVTEPRR